GLSNPQATTLLGLLLPLRRIKLPSESRFHAGNRFVKRGELNSSQNDGSSSWTTVSVSVKLLGSCDFELIDAERQRTVTIDIDERRRRIVLIMMGLSYR